MQNPKLASAVGWHWNTHIFVSDLRFEVRVIMEKIVEILVHSFCSFDDFGRKLIFIVKLSLK